MKQGQRLVQRQDERQDYETPPDLFLSLSREFGPFDVDVAANETNHKVPVYFGPGGVRPDALAEELVGRCWMNPPYGRQTGPFVKKASESRALVVCLIPARTDTAWFHEYVLPRAKTIRWIRGRPRFWLDGKPALSWSKKLQRFVPASGKFPSMVVVFDGRV